MKVEVLVTQLCPTLCYPMDCSLSGFSAHGILQRILQQVDIPFSRGSSRPRDQSQVSCIILEPIEWPKGSKASCEVWRKDQGLLSRSGRKRSPQSRDDGGFSRAAAPVWGFSRGMTGSSGSLSCGAREVRCPCAWRGGACHCSRVMVGESVLKTR